MLPVLMILNVGSAGVEVRIEATRIMASERVSSLGTAPPMLAFCMQNAFSKHLTN